MPPRKKKPARTPTRKRTPAPAQSPPPRTTKAIPACALPKLTSEQLLILSMRGHDDLYLTAMRMRDQAEQAKQIAADFAPEIAERIETLIRLATLADKAIETLLKKIVNSDPDEGTPSPQKRPDLAGAQITAGAQIIDPESR